MRALFSFEKSQRPGIVGGHVIT